MIEKSKRDNYAGLFLLKEMVKNKLILPSLLEGQDADLEPVLEKLMAESKVEIDSNHNYQVTALGKREVARFESEYKSYLRRYDVFCAVDLVEGEIAYAYYNKVENEQEWTDLLEQDRWDDLRLAVAEFEGKDPYDIVFMSFLNEGRFSTENTGWQFDLVLGSTWDDLSEIVETALTVTDLGYEDEQGKVDGRDVVKDVIAHGEDIIESLWDDEDEED